MNTFVRKASRAAAFGVLFLALALQTSCATMVNGTTQTVWVSSEPMGATVYVDRVKVGKTPLHICLARSDNHMVGMKLEGHEPYEIMMTRSYSKWLLGNLFIGGLPGLTIDALTGSCYRFSPEIVFTEFAELEALDEQEG